MPPKTDGTVGLNNYLQALGRPAALNWLETQAGPEQAPTWTCIAKIDGVEYGRGQGGRKFIARDAASDQALARLRSEAGS
ncbi:hypothetical protein CYLTODRAFT_486235 [Cylindrobasidium torrendii FP15055 ss-10]|uniref:DRBM domain-containing protein n=1 Tax=Cylindrobasidium torrendii FP15055 ss-10 TaxID=1314674 RepID=A0A0D7BQZ7_9AGAR|nr:hypothetical protein CYLTODRAFT_486235 [Cylindrobasidium torrendii FP15055 ss-10]